MAKQARRVYLSDEAIRMLYEAMQFYASPVSSPTTKKLRDRFQRLHERKPRVKKAQITPGK